MAGFVAVLAVIGFIIGAVYYLIGAVLLVIGVHLGGGRVWVLYGAWIGAVVLLVVLAFGGAASGVFSSGTTPSPTSSSTTQEANVRLEFTGPYAGISPTGPSHCWRRVHGGPVAGMGTDNVHMSTDWRWGPGLDKYVRVDLTWDQPGVGEGELTVWLSDRSLAGAAYYADTVGGRVVRNVAADGTSGQITFTGLAHRPDIDFDPTAWPDTISGTLSWSCTGPERTASPT